MRRGGWKRVGVLLFSVESLAHPHQIGKRLSLHLTHDPTSLGFYGDLCSAKFRRHLLVQQSPHNQLHHFALAWR
jgi:hypothetical protein